MKGVYIHYVYKLITSASIKRTNCILSWYFESNRTESESITILRCLTFALTGNQKDSSMAVPWTNPTLLLSKRSGRQRSEGQRLHIISHLLSFSSHYFHLLGEVAPNSKPLAICFELDYSNFCPLEKAGKSIQEHKLNVPLYQRIYRGKSSDMWSSLEQLRYQNWPCYTTETVTGLRIHSSKAKSSQFTVKVYQIPFFLTP